MAKVTFSTRNFTELNVAELYSILRLRSEVFVLEQKCLYQDMDNKDTEDGCEHVLMHKHGLLCGYARILPPKLSYEDSSIGRVLIAEDYRNIGLAKMLMDFCISRTFELFPNNDIQIGAQCYLENFYASLGFVATSQPYDEDGIMHLDMTLTFRQF